MGGERSFFKDWLLYCLVLCFISMLLGLSLPVFAADDDEEDDEFTLEEIIVTAEKREAVLQKVPMDITVVRPDDMERFNVHQMSQLQKMIPELSTAEGAAGTGFLNLSIRGNESKYWNPTSEQTVAVNIDGMPLTRSNGLEGKFYDLERVEMLAGPQGTLYGRGSTAGSLTMISKRPDIGQFGGNIQFEYGSFNRRRIEGALNVPATDKLAFRMSGRSIQRDAQDDVGISVQDMWGMRGSINWEPSDRQSLVITVDTDSTNNRGGYGYNGVYFKAFGDVEIVANPDPNLTDEFRKYASGGTVRTPYKARWFYTEGDDEQQQRSDSWGTSATYEHELDWGWLVAKYGYRSVTQDLSYVAAQQPTLQPLGSYTTKSWFNTDTMDPETGEITPSGTAPGDDGYGEVNWYNTTYQVQQDPLTGDNIPVTQLILYAPQTTNYVSTLSNTVSRTSNFETYFNSAQSIADGDKIQWIAGGLLTNDSVTEIARVSENVHDSWDLREYALYGQLQYAPFAGLTFSGGYRYLWDTKKFEGNDYGTGLHGSGPDSTWGQYIPRPQDPSMFNHYTYKVDFNTYQGNVSWQATEDIMTYVSYSKGMKTIELGRDGRPVPPEQMNSAEAAVRSRFFNGRLQTNLTVYYQEYKNRNDWYNSYQCRIPQYNNDGVFTGCQVIGESASNVDYVEQTRGVLSPGGSKGHGGRADITWRITLADTLRINASYEHNEYDEYNVGNAMREAFERYWGEGNVHSAELPDNKKDRSGEEFGGRPWRGNITYTRMWYIGTDMLMTSLTGFYEGEGLEQYKHRGDDDETVWEGNPDYITLDASINYSSTKWVPEGCRWTFSVYGNNILDNDELASRWWNDGTEGFFQTWRFPANSGYISGTFLPPRTIGASFTLNF